MTMKVIYLSESEPVIVSPAALRRLRACGLVERKRRGQDRRVTPAGESYLRAVLSGQRVPVPEEWPR
jgi:hypothetical protein